MERIWPEANSRANSSLKRVFSMQEEELDMTDDICKLCVSFVSCNVASSGLSKFVGAGNCRSLPGEFVILYSLG